MHEDGGWRLSPGREGNRHAPPCAGHPRLYTSGCKRRWLHFSAGFDGPRFKKMDESAKLLTSVAALLGAFAWPGAFLVVVFLFKGELKLILKTVPLILDRVKKAKLAGIAFELDRVADAETQSESDKSGKITAGQIEAAARIEIETRDVGTEALLRELDRLCLEYDSLRRTLPSGSERTRAMTRVLVKMRSLAPSLVDFVDTYKSSGSPGSRLAAIAMMQMVPRSADLHWLKDRFSFEQPFLFYHAALALQNVANISNTAEERNHLRDVTQQALRTLKGFAGVPDANTVEILESLLSDLSKG
jgi:hypothetical protein